MDAQHMDVQFGASKPLQKAVFVGCTGVLGALSHGSMPVCPSNCALQELLLVPNDSYVRTSGLDNYNK